MGSFTGILGIESIRMTVNTSPILDSVISVPLAEYGVVVVFGFAYNCADGAAETGLVDLFLVKKLIRRGDVLSNGCRFSGVFAPKPHPTLP